MAAKHSATRHGVAPKQSAASRARWANTTPAERSAHARMMQAARWANTTPAERSAHGRLMRAALSGRCTGTTRRGTRCASAVPAGARYCWHHADGA